MQVHFFLHTLPQSGEPSGISGELTQDSYILSKLTQACYNSLGENPQKEAEAKASALRDQLEQLMRSGMSEVQITVDHRYLVEVKRAQQLGVISWDPEEDHFVITGSPGTQIQDSGFASLSAAWQRCLALELEPRTYAYLEQQIARSHGASMKVWEEGQETVPAYLISQETVPAYLISQETVPGAKELVLDLQKAGFDSWHDQDGRVYSGYWNGPPSQPSQT